MFSAFLPALRLWLALTLLTGVLYPAVVTLIARFAFPAQANGSLLLVEGTPRGSHLLGQSFTNSGHFWGRPSATSGGPYEPMASGGSNLGPTNPAQVERVQARLAAHSAAGDRTNGIPVDLVTASGSGLDPHVSIAAARFQRPRVARVNAMPVSVLDSLIERATEPRTLGMLGEPRVHVLHLNVALDAWLARRATQP